MTTNLSKKAGTFLLLAMGSVAFFFTPFRTQAQVVTLTDTVAPTNAVTVTQGQTFIFSINITTTVDTVGITYRLTEPTGTAVAPHFQITARDTTGTAFGDLTTTNTVMLQATNPLLDPSNNNDLGGTIAASDPTNPKPAGTYFIATFTLQALPTTPVGTYSIQLTSDSVLANADFSETPIASAPYLVTVTAIPEPSSLAFIGIFGCVMLVARRRASA